jgi:hypothetical protein
VLGAYGADAVGRRMQVRRKGAALGHVGDKKWTAGSSYLRFHFQTPTALAEEDRFEGCAFAHRANAQTFELIV